MRRALLILCLGALLVESLPALASASTKTYPSCLGGDPQYGSQSSCSVGSQFGAAIQVRPHRHYTYKLKIRGPKDKTFKRTTNGRGFNFYPMAAHGFDYHLGHYTLRWYHHGHLLDKDNFTITVGD